MCIYRASDHKMAVNFSASEENCTHHVYNVEDFEIAQIVHNPTTTFIAAVAMPIVLCIGVCANTSFLFAVIRAPKRKSHTTLYLVHIALADLLYLGTSAPVKIGMKYASPLVDTDPFVSSAQCVIFFSLLHLGYYSSIALVTMVSYERFLSLCHPLQLCRIRSRKRTYRLITLCWLVGLAFAGVCVPIIAKVQTFHCLLWPDKDEYRDFPSSVTYIYCKSVESVEGYEYIFSLFIDIIPWFSALAANTYMYVCIISALIKFKRTGSRISSSREALRTGNRVAKMVVVNGVVFFVCQTPYSFLTFYSLFCKFINVPSTYSLVQYFVTALLLHFNSAINPLIYNAMNPQYRAALVEACRGKGRGRDSTDPSHRTISTASNRNRNKDNNTRITDTSV